MHDTPPKVILVTGAGSEIGRGLRIRPYNTTGQPIFIEG